MSNLKTNLTSLEALIDKAKALPEEKKIQDSKTVAPSTSAQTITPDSGYDGFAQVLVNGDDNLVAENIKSGVSIFGVAGSYEGSGDGSGGVEMCTVTLSSEEYSGLYSSNFAYSTGESFHAMESEGAHVINEINVMKNSIVVYDPEEGRDGIEVSGGCEVLYQDGTVWIIGVTGNGTIHHYDALDDIPPID